MVALSGYGTVVHDLLGWTFPVGILQCHFREEPQTLSNFFQVFCQVVSCFYSVSLHILTPQLNNLIEEFLSHLFELVHVILVGNTV